MLITFRSKAASDVMMFGEHAKRILTLLHKDTQRGVITAEQAPQALAILEKEVAESRAHPVSDEVQHDIDAHHHGADDDAEHEGAQSVSFATRVFPLMEMLRAAQAKGHDVVWGV
ncbi:DUF1840 domain-containing protein [Massilia sp. TS11]|uniref:DUF1840 domain-containing protein n=1 Tax=Massilia sp. TS11 TaxID=2908003 RepID=UPI001EDABA82|nr:DUF1840 domain-containing protein [Massilia sp. TS11]MCG2585514.1 DUF1840 domain-containing protein [Massilia sp. TS11]